MKTIRQRRFGEGHCCEHGWAARVDGGQCQGSVVMAKQYQLRLILMDLNLPDMNGIEAMHLLSHQIDTHPIPVIAISAAAFMKNNELGLQAGFKSY
ncbi:MAG: hypothetical protein COB59_01240 [Rhodospirillaceae bacterium]|nr:MAG: hypothetical protein COB59_01240 [Rhodospirillaceae bacterium]